MIAGIIVIVLILGQIDACISAIELPRIRRQFVLKKERDLLICRLMEKEDENIRLLNRLKTRNKMKSL